MTSEGNLKSASGYSGLGTIINVGRKVHAKVLANKDSSRHASLEIYVMTRDGQTREGAWGVRNSLGLNSGEKTPKDQLNISFRAGAA